MTVSPLPNLPKPNRVKQVAHLFWGGARHLFVPPMPVGLILGSLFFLAALTPSLTPRSGLIQGVLAGCNFALGYGLGVALVLIWRWLGFKSLTSQTKRRVLYASLAFMIVVVVTALNLAAGWQNDVRAAMDMPPVETGRPFTVAGLALLVSAFLIGLGRLFRLAKRAVSNRLDNFVPRRLAFFIALGLTGFLFFVVGNDLVARRAFVALDRLYAAADAKGADDIDTPTRAAQSGSASSLVRWDKLGAQGRAFVTQGPTAAEISAITGQPALDPLRIYVGLGSAETAQERARLALAEAIRVGAFERQVLVLATPTGTGWMDPKAHFPLDVLTHGDVATVGVQYSYLASWLSLMTVPDYGQESARAVFLTFYDHWNKLPPQTRPRLYLFGLSLGAMNTDLSNDVYDFIDAPYQGAFYAGAPFTTRSWDILTTQRDKGSPAWLPRFRNGESVRFMNNQGLPEYEAPWGRTRFLYLQYASDGTVFFSPDLLWRKPDWMKGQRGPDVSDRLVWLPVITFLQVGFDLFTAPNAPLGHGHVYAGRDYMHGWNALLDLNRDETELAKIEAAMTERDY